MNNVVPITRKRPRTFTRAEMVLDEIRERIHMDTRKRKEIAGAAKVSPTTISNIVHAKTIWPRPNTLFPLMRTLGMKMHIEVSEQQETTK